MAASAGRDARLKIGGTTVAGVKTVGFTREASQIEITDQSSGAYAEFLADTPANISLTINLEGVEKDGVLRNLALGNPSGYLISAAELEFVSGGDKLVCDFWFGQYTETMPMEEATAFTAVLTSSGAWTYTPAP